MSTLDRILQTREHRNERTVAIVRMIFALTGILDFLDYLGILHIEGTTKSKLLIALFIFTYSLILLVLLFRNRYYRHLKYFAVLLDYFYIILNFILDPTLTADHSTAVWYAFAAVTIFFLINLLRYSRSGTLFTAVLSIGVYFGVGAYFKLPSPSIIQVGLPLSLVLLIGYWISSSTIKMMREANTKQMMERYLPPQLVGELYQEKSNLDPGGNTQVVTILFSDIRSFTTISENMPASDVVEFLNEYLSKMTGIIFHHRGTIDKFIGDAIMTIFGAPVANEDDAQRAVKTAIAMQAAMGDFNKNGNTTGKPLEIGIGIHTGEVIAGNIGSEQRLDYTVIGDNVNLCSRIEGLTKHYQCPILVTESVRVALSGVEDNFVLREVDCIVVMGRTEGVTIFEVLSFTNDKEREAAINLKENYEKGLSLYRNRDFQGASVIFTSLEPDYPSIIFGKRCQYLITHPPTPSWKPIHRMKNK